jgi:hypothetical protein
MSLPEPKVNGEKNRDWSFSKKKTHDHRMTICSLRLSINLVTYTRLPLSRACVDIITVESVRVTNNCSCQYDLAVGTASHGI